MGEQEGEYVTDWAVAGRSGTITIAAAAAMAVKIRELWQHALNQRGGERESEAGYDTAWREVDLSRLF